MFFKDRQEAGKLLAQALMKYQDEDVIVYALPRGGVVVAAEIAGSLKAPLDLILAHKIGHPYQLEYAIAAVSEGGYVVGNPREIQTIDKQWFEMEKNRQIREIKRKRELYLKGRKEIQLKNKVAILVDDGIATGLTMQVGILELKHQKPKKIVIAVPVTPKSTADLIKKQVDEFVALEIPPEHQFLGAVGAYYQDFSQTEDDEVIQILENHAKELEKK